MGLDKLLDYERLLNAINAPSSYEEFLAYLSRAGMSVAEDALDRDFSKARDEDDDVAVLKHIYDKAGKHWANYEM